MAAEVGEILKSIDELAARGKISRQRAFAAWFAINFFALDEDDALEAAAADGGNDQGIDIAFADETSQELIVIQAHCPDNLKITPKAKWDALTASLPFVAAPERLADAGRPDLAELLLEIKKVHPDYSVSVGLITLGLSARLRMREAVGFGLCGFPDGLDVDQGTSSPAGRLRAAATLPD